MYRSLFWSTTHVQARSSDAGNAAGILSGRKPEAPVIETNNYYPQQRDGKKIVANLIGELGFDSVDAETIAQSWRQQPGTPSYGMDFGVEELIDALARATPDRTADWRA